jgi:hypothetical protein
MIIKDNLDKKHSKVLFIFVAQIAFLALFAHL